MNWIKKYKTILLIAAVPVLVVLWWLFRPEKLWVNEKVNEPAPFVASEGEPTLISTGKLEAKSQPTQGRASLYKSSDGKLELRLTDFETAKSDGLSVILLSPDDAAHLMDAKVAPMGASLGAVQASTAEQHFAVPANADVTKLTEVVVYEMRGNQVYGLAKLEAF
jgi:Electron transfer DM13